MKILLINTWHQWPSSRPYLDHTANEIWHTCDEYGVGYIRNFVGENSIKGFNVVPTDDVGLFVESLQKIYSHFQFERVVACCELTVMGAALAREMFNIPGPKMAEVEPYRDKKKMKELVARHGVRVARDLDPAELRRGGFTPCVVKRPDGASAIDVHICRSLSDFEAHRDALDHGALLEEYVDGDVFHVDGAFNESGMSAMPHAYIGNCFDHYNTAKPLGSVGVDDPVLKARLLEMTRQVLAALPLREGIFHLEIIRSRRDELVFLEIACRIGGGDIYTNFVDVYNFDLLEFHIASQLGQAPALRELRQDEVAGWVKFNHFPHVPGVFTSLRCGKLAEDNCMYLAKNPNARLGRKVHDRRRHFVTFALRAKSSAEVRASITDLIDNVALETSPALELAEAG
jgi:hypothetical protein